MSLLFKKGHKAHLGETDVIRQASCAASSGEGRTQEDVREALRLGIRAAQWGISLPLALCLDLRALDVSCPWSPIERFVKAPIKQLSSYDEFLCGLWQMSVLSGHPGRRLAYGNGMCRFRKAENYLPLLYKRAGCNGKSSFRYAAGYRQFLCSEDSCAEIHRQWSRPRGNDTAMWDWWLETPETTPSAVEKVQALTAVPEPAYQAWTGECFAYDAADFYIGSKDPELSSGQRQRLLNLHNMVVRREQVASVMAYEEQDPNVGRWMLFTLVSGEYGEHKIVNGSYPRISALPKVQIVEKMRMFLTWMQPWPSNKRSYLAQGLTALVVDDLREAFAHLPIRLFVQRPAPVAAQVKLGRGGSRWRRALTDSDKLAAPSAFTSTVFFLPSLAQMARMSPGWDCGCGFTDRSLDWWAGIILESDLEQIGFQRCEDIDGRSLPSWRAPAGGSPCFPPLESVGVVSDDGAGAIHRVWRDKDGVYLRPDAVINKGTQPDASYCRWRNAFLDCAISAVERRCY